MSLRPVVAVLLCAVLGAPACAPAKAPPPAPCDASNLVSATAGFDRAEKALAQNDLDTAACLFDGVRRYFPYSKRAMQAEIGLGDVARKRGDDQGAARLYGQWLEHHPNQPDLAAEVRAKLDEVQRAATSR